GRQFNLALVANGAAHELESQGGVRSGFSQPHMSIVRFGYEVTLLNRISPRPGDFRRQPFDQKLALDLSITSTVHRQSVPRGNQAGESVLSAVRRRPDFIHEFVPGKSGRTFLLLHGTGGNERDLIPLGHDLDPDASLLSPRGKVLENGMPRFFRRLAEGVFDLEDLQKRTHELADFVVSAAAHYKIDINGVVAVGYSNGANIAAS